MKKTWMVWAALLALTGPLRAGSIWVNELHYDNSGGDTAEFFEIVAPSSIADLSAITLNLYNGNNGKRYDSHSLDTFTPGTSIGDYTLYSKSISGVQNGAPDGVALDQSGTLLQFLSYEGSITAADGPALGLTSIDIGMAEDGSTPAGSSLGLTGIGAGPADFKWSVFTEAASPGLLNPGQEFAAASSSPVSAVPESNEWVLLIAGSVMGLLVYLRKHQTMSAQHE